MCFSFFVRSVHAVQRRMSNLESAEGITRPPAKNEKVTRTNWSFLGQKSTFPKRVHIDPKVSYVIRKCLRVCNSVIVRSIGAQKIRFLKTRKFLNFANMVSFASKLNLCKEQPDRCEHVACDHDMSPSVRCDDFKLDR